MLVSQIIKQKGGSVYSVTPEVSLAEAVRQLNERRVGALLVLDGGRITGVFSERDVVRVLAEGGEGALSRPVSSAMSAEVVSAKPTETVDELLGRMTDRRIRHLPVVSREGELCGMVSIGDLVKHKISEVEAEAQTLKNYIAAG